MNKMFGLLMSGVIMATSLTSVTFAENDASSVNYIRASIVEDLVGVNIEDSFYADELMRLGIIEDGGIWFHPEKELTRIEGFVTLYNLINNAEDNDSELDSYKNSDVKVVNRTPFKDVPEWATKEINYLYEKELINGVTDTSILPDEKMNANEFTTLILRIKGYSDVLGDFRWDKAIEKAVEIDLIAKSASEQLKSSKSFTEAHMSYIIYSGIEVKIK